MAPQVDPAVDAWFEAKKHPQAETMQAVRQAILDADGRVTESIKWQSPTFAYKGNLASIMPGAKQFVSLMFHRGAEIPGSHPELQGGGDVARYMRFDSVADVAAKRDALAAAVKAWCDARDAKG
ncbi:MAG: DUF1801 domain-containing protein [Chloroflexi bacterium]|nr:DUF1801 domain-containing protein [Chloroflexota bacterium]